MGLETGTYISDLVSANPLGSDAKSTSDDHLRLIKSCVKATFPNVSGAVTPTHTELNYVDGVTSAIQTQIDTKGAVAGQTWTGTHTFPATTYGVTASTGDSSTKYATTAFVAATAFSSALPAQTGANGKLLTSNGTDASWTAVKTINSTSIIGSGDIAITSGLTLLATLTPTAAANVDFLTTFSSTYDNYLIIGNGLLPSADDRLTARCAVSGSADSSSLYPSVSGAASTSTQNATFYIHATNALSEGTGLNFKLFVLNVNSTNSTKDLYAMAGFKSAATPTWSFDNRRGTYNNTAVVTGLRLYWDAGSNFVAQGKIRIYGYQNS